MHGLEIGTFVEHVSAGAASSPPARRAVSPVIDFSDVLDHSNISCLTLYNQMFTK